MRIIFMGTPEFAVPSLEMLIREGYDVVAAVTQPDKPKGRGKKLTFPPVKETAVKEGIKVLQPSKVRTEEFLKQLKELEPDLLVTVAYGRILTGRVLGVPRYGCINVHGSLLPKLRGAAPIQWAVINGEKTTGVTTMFTDEGLDTGDMLLKREIGITENMTAGELHDIMAVVGAEVLKETLKELENGTLKRIPQDNSLATYAPIMKREHGEINWQSKPDEIYNLIRGTNPWPGAYTIYKGERMRIWASLKTNSEGKKARPGTILKVDRDGILVSTGEGNLLITEVQFDSCRKMCVSEYICGHEIIAGEVLG